MSTYCKIEVYYKPEVPDIVGQSIVEDITTLGINGIDSVRTAMLYYIEGTFDRQTVERISRELLTDAITQVYSYASEGPNREEWTIEVQFKPGVTDAVGDSTVKGIKDLGIAGVTAVRTGHKYWLTGQLTGEVLETIANRLLINDVIQTFSYQAPNSHKHESQSLSEA